MNHQRRIRPQVSRHPDLLPRTRARGQSAFIAPGRAIINRQEEAGTEWSDALGDSEQIVPIHALVLDELVVRAHAARVHHDAPLLVRLRVQQVVALRAEVERRLARQGRLLVGWVPRRGETGTHHQKLRTSAKVVVSGEFGRVTKRNFLHYAITGLDR
jgi:hypothetical protein